MLFNEPKLLKYKLQRCTTHRATRFSALQRAEIAEIDPTRFVSFPIFGFSALQRAEIAEILPLVSHLVSPFGFSALQRAEIAEMVQEHAHSERV